MFSYPLIRLLKNRIIFACCININYKYLWAAVFKGQKKKRWKNPAKPSINYIRTNHPTFTNKKLTTNNKVSMI